VPAQFSEVRGRGWSMCLPTGGRGGFKTRLYKAMSDYSAEADDSVLSETLDEVKEPSMYRVLIHNDDYTTMEFVVEILVSVFNKPVEDAINIMLKVHREGIGLCGVYTHDVAETKVGTVEKLAVENGFPLKCSMERDL